jgi:glycerol-1-phosphate dehydrogenase [NAD(P)+]
MKNASQEIFVKTTEDIHPHLINFCSEKKFTNILLVCDSNTYSACGRNIEQVLKDRGRIVRVVNLGEGEIMADEEQLIKVMIAVDQDTGVLLAAGSGTLTDITRFVSHRVRLPFISIPTAPSVDGFVSIGSPLVIHHLKKTILCKPPIALFGDLRILSKAPQKMIAAGFGDLIGKYLSLADWKLGNLIREEPIDAEIYQRLFRSVESAVKAAPEIGKGTPEGIRQLMEGLIQSGFCMLDFGNTSPASGAEHHISHFWEMKLIQENRPGVLHGAKVGVASIISAGWFERINKITKYEIADLISHAVVPKNDPIEEEIRSVFGENAEEIIKEQKWFLHMTPVEFQKIKERIIEKWDDILEIANRVPLPSQLSKWLQELGAPIHPKELGFDDLETKQALEYSHYLRDRFTINKFRILFGKQIFG